MNSCKIIRRQNLSTASWSGGTLSQLYIYPEPSRYEERDFLFQITTATVELEDTTFSDLTGYTRITMTLDRPLALNHDGAPEVRLNKYEPHLFDFDGGAQTVSRGRVTDFNLVMKTGACRGEMKALALPPEGRLMDGGQRPVVEAVYCIRGECVFQGADKSIIHTGDLVVLDHRLAERDYGFFKYGCDGCELIVSTVNLS